MFLPSSMQSEQQESDPDNGPDFSWRSTKIFWIVIIVAGVVLMLHLLYKTGKRERYKRPIRTTPGLRFGTRPTEATGDRQPECGLQRPWRAMTRRCSVRSSSSEMSVLPRYEPFAEGEVRAQDVQVEKRGRYTYVLGEAWPGHRERAREGGRALHLGQGMTQAEGPGWAHQG